MVEQSLRGAGDLLRERWIRLLPFGIAGLLLFSLVLMVLDSLLVGPAFQRPAAAAAASPSTLYAAIPRVAIAALVISLLVTCIGAVLVRALAADEPVFDHGILAALQLGAVLSQVALCSIPVVAVLLLAALGVFSTPAGAVVLLAILLALVMGAGPFAGAALVGAALGDVARRPVIAWELVRPYLFNAGAIMLLATVALVAGWGIAFVVTAAVPGGSFVGGAVAIVSCMVAVALLVALYTDLDGPVSVDQFQRFQLESAGPAAAHEVDGDEAGGDVVQLHPDEAHQDAPEQLTGVLVPNEPCGQWVELPAGGVARVQLAWTDGPPVALGLADSGGRWLMHDQPSQNGGMTAVSVLHPGFYWLHLAARGPQPQSYRLAIHAPEPVSPQMLAA